MCHYNSDDDDSNNRIEAAYVSTDRHCNTE